MKALVALFAMSSCLVSVSLTKAADASNLAGIVETRILPMMAEHNIPGLALGLTINGEEHVYNFGVASLETRQPVTNTTVFEIGSVSKIFTATLGSLAAVTGELSLDERPSLYLPELAGSSLDQATLLNLATYSAGGLPLQFPETIKSEADGWTYLQNWSPAAAPNEQRRYSNPSIGLFGRVTASAFQGQFSDLVGVLFAALDMNNTYIEVPGAAMGRYAWGHDREGHPIRVSAGFFDAEAYGVKSSASDLLRLLEANIRPQDLDETLGQAIRGTHLGHFKVGGMVQGLGWEQYPYPVALDQLLAGNSTTMAMEANPATALTPPAIPSAATLFNKTGSTNGFAAYVAFVPKERIGLVLLANKNFPITARVTTALAILDQIAE